MACGMDVARIKRGCRAHQLSLSDTRGKLAAGFLALFAVCNRVGIEERQAGHPLGRQAHDLESDISAHRQAGEREARWCVIEKAPGDVTHAAVSTMINDHHLAMGFQCRKLRAKKSCGAAEARYKNQR